MKKGLFSSRKHPRLQFCTASRARFQRLTPNGNQTMREQMMLPDFGWHRSAKDYGSLYSKMAAEIGSYMPAKMPNGYVPDLHIDTLREALELH